MCGVVCIKKSYILIHTIHTADIYENSLQITSAEHLVWRQGVVHVCPHGAFTVKLFQETHTAVGRFVISCTLAPTSHQLSCHGIRSSKGQQNRKR